MKKEESKTFNPGNEFPRLINENGKNEVKGEVFFNKSSIIPEVYPVSKADRTRERAFKNRIHNNTKYLKSNLRG